MSKVLKWKYNDFFGDHLRREKLINIIICEIIFLRSKVKNYELKSQQYDLYQALKKLEYLLNLLKNNNNEISDRDFDRVILFIYGIFKEIAQNLT